MSSRKKSTTTEESSSGSTSSSGSSTGSSSGSDDSASTTSCSDSSSSDEKSSPPSTQKEQKPPTTTTSTRRRSSETRTNRIISEEKLQKDQHASTSVQNITSNTKTNKAQSGRSNRNSKSSLCSSDDEINPKDINPVKKLAVAASVSSILKSTTSERKKSVGSIQELKKPFPHPQQAPPVGGGKAPPSVVKQQQQQNLTKSNNSKQAILKPTAMAKCVVEKDKNKTKSIFSPDNSSDSENEKKIVSSKAPTLQQKAKLQNKTKPKVPVPVKKPVPIKKSDSKSSASCSETGSSSEDESSSDSSTHSDDESDSEESDSKPSQKKSTTQTNLQTKKATGNAQPSKNNLSKSSSSSDQITPKNSTIVATDSDAEQINNTSPTKQPVRKLTRSSSTRKSKHLIGKAQTDSESEASNSCPTKSKTKAKKNFENKPAPNNFVHAFSPAPEIQRCPIDGCDSIGHLSGDANRHFLPEACPIYHNMSVAECKDRADERKAREDSDKKLMIQYETQKVKFSTPEQKIYLQKIRDNRARFKPPLTPQHGARTPNSVNEKLKIKIPIDNSREPNLVGLVPEYDLNIFREAQAMASEKIEKELKELPVGKGIKYISMGKYQMKVWYQSPYPEDVARIPKMYICEFCLRYQKSEIGMKRHSVKCVWRHPPGDEIYRKGKLQVWQVDGKRHKQYCQHLCLLAKFFLDHKTLYYDVEPFLFYVMTLFDHAGCHTVGYFSKEKNSFLNYNVSCILTLPPYQRKGYGRLLIDFSYLLTRVERKIGSPEKPLSDLGLISYRSYWKDVLLEYLCTRTGTTLSIKDLSQDMAIYSYDIVSTLQALGMMKYWKGKHIVLKKQDVLEEYEERIRRRGNFPKIDASCLRWKPFVPPQNTDSP